MKILAWWLLFASIQIINLILIVPGFLICASPSLAKATWLWWNSDDGDIGTTWLQRYVWLALRNPVSNLRHVRGVSGKGRPLLYSWTGSAADGANPRPTTAGFYVKIGWEQGAPYYPVFSFGSGRGY
jgi:hypothetical protein